MLLCRTGIISMTIWVLASPAIAEEQAPLMQAFIGSLKLDDQTAEWDELGEVELDVEFPSSLPSGGVEAEYAYGGETLKWGINSGGSIAWKNSDTRISGGFSGDTGGVVRIELDNSLFIGELHLGGFVRSHLGDRISIYAAAGPMIMYGKHKVEDEDVVSPTPDASGQIVITSSDESDFSVGVYGRAGIDFQYSAGQFIGLGVRYMKAEMDFDKTIGKLDLEGPQVVFTYTAQL